MALFDNLAGLEVRVESVGTETKETRVSEDFPRKTTIVTLDGRHSTGRGEDVIYDPSLHEYPETLEEQLQGTYRFRELSARLSECDLCNDDLEYDETQASYRQWAVESAALDLALKQRDTNLARALEREYRPVRFVVSPSVDEHALDELRKVIDSHPGIEFKLDAKASWNRDIVSALASLNRVRVVDFKSHYDGFGRDPDYELYRTVAEEFEDVVLEDPKLIPETRPAFDGHEHRIAWDKPITGIESIEQLPIRPSRLNIKPSRFGTVEALLETVEYCRNRGIEMYGGGQFELGVGRHHIQAIASLFYPDAPNDVAPRCYNSSDIPEIPPQSPLHPDRPLSGFQWRYEQSMNGTMTQKREA